MARHPKPWFWKARNAWYVQINGKQVKLGENKREVEREFYRVMAAEGRLDPRQREHILVADACEAMLSQAQIHRDSTRRHYREKLSAFAERFGERELASIRPAEVIAWIINHKGTGRREFGEPSKALQFSFVKRLFKWARATGLIQLDPFVMTSNPWKIKARERAMDDHEYESVMTKSNLNPQFKFVLELIWRTGMRPGDAATLAARHLDTRLPVIRLQPTEHKTGTKTGNQREIYVPPDLWEKLQRLAAAKPKGPIVLNSRGKPWTGKSISKAFSYVKKSLGLNCVLYQARHRYLTKLVDNGVPAARVAKIAGHSDTKSLMKHYYHPEAEQMVADVAVVGEADVGQKAGIAAKIAAHEDEARARRLEAKRLDSRRYRATKKLGAGT